LVLAGVVLSVFYYATQPTPPSPTTPVAEAPEPPAEPGIRYPIEREPEEKTLPALSESDPAVREALGGLWGERALEQLFLNGFIRRVVATVDNLPREKLSLRLMPVKPAAGKFRTAGKGESLTVTPDNAARYAPYMELAAGIDSAKLVAVYAHYYPLFQQAYEDLGYPQGYFNDRLVEVIDHLLAAPEVPAQTKLVQPKVFYRFADPDLETRSAGQKILMRIGNENAARIKAKLREIRSELTRSGPHE
jgi:hypothetical protein